MVVSSYIWWLGRKQRRLKESGCIYRSAARSLQQGVTKKSTGKEEWFKDQKKRKRDQYDEVQDDRAKKR